MRKFWRSIVDQRHLIHWQQYRHFFSIQILKYFVVWFSVVPVAAYVLHGLPDQFALPLPGGKVGVVNVGLPFNWLVLWFASVAYTVALLIYAFACPGFIRRYPNFHSYLEERHSPRWMPWVVSHAITPFGNRGATKLIQRMLTKKFLVPDRSAVLTDGLLCEVVVEADYTRMLYLHLGQPHAFTMPVRSLQGIEDSERTSEVERETFWEVFAYYSGAKFAARFCILVLLFAALTLFLYVLFEHVWSVVPYLLHAFGFT